MMICKGVKVETHGGRIHHPFIGPGVGGVHVRSLVPAGTRAAPCGPGSRQGGLETLEHPRRGIYPGQSALGNSAVLDGYQLGVGHIDAVVHICVEQTVLNVNVAGFLDIDTMIPVVIELASKSKSSFL